MLMRRGQKGLNDFKFGAFVGQFLNVRVASMTMKVLNITSKPIQFCSGDFFSQNIFHSRTSIFARNTTFGLMNLTEVFARNPTQMIAIAFSHFSEFYRWQFAGFSYADLASFCLDHLDAVLLKG